MPMREVCRSAALASKHRYAAIAVRDDQRSAHHNVACRVVEKRNHGGVRHPPA
jgi:hypothetical protein